MERPVADRRSFLATTSALLGSALSGCTTLGIGEDEPAGQTGFDPDDPGTHAQFQYDGANTGYAPYGSVGDDPGQLWQFTRGEQRPDYGIGTPAVADGLVFVAETPADGSAANTAYALDPAGGSVVWTTPVGGPKGPPIAVAAGVVVVQRPTPIALYPADGTVAWEADDELNLQFDLAIAAERAYAVDFGLSGPRLVAIGLDDGRVRWETDLEGSLQTLPKVAVADGVLYVGGRSLRAFGTDGSHRWTARPEHAVTAAPTVEGDRIFVAGPGGSVSAVGLDGEVRWETTVEMADAVTGSGEILDSPATDGERVYVHHGGRTTALDPTDGSVAWTADSVLSDPPIVGEAGVYLAGLNRLVSLDPATGDHRWTYDADAEVGGRITPVLVDGAVLFSSDGLHAIGT